jgi:N-acetylglutamate synthase/N-acetylornithine aminotransferase
VTAHATEADESDGLFVAHWVFPHEMSHVWLWKAQIVKEAESSDLQTVVSQQACVLAGTLTSVKPKAARVTRQRNKQTIAACE